MLDEAFDILAELDSTESSMPELYKLLGTIYERKEELGKAVAEFKKALGLRKRVVVPYFVPFVIVTHMSGMADVRVVVRGIPLRSLLSI